MGGAERAHRRHGTRWADLGKAPQYLPRAQTPRRSRPDHASCRSQPSGGADQLASASPSRHSTMPRRSWSRIVQPFREGIGARTARATKQAQMHSAVNATKAVLPAHPSSQALARSSPRGKPALSRRASDASPTAPRRPATDVVKTRPAARPLPGLLDTPTGEPQCLTGPPPRTTGCATKGESSAANWDPARRLDRSGALSSGPVPPRTDASEFASPAVQFHRRR